MATYKVNSDGSITKTMANGTPYTVSTNDERYSRVANEAVGAGGSIKGPIAAPAASAPKSSGNNSGGNTQTNSVTEKPPVTTESILSNTQGSGQGTNLPYGSAIADIISQYPKATPKTQEELMGAAQNYSSLQITPQLEALQRSIAQAGTTANSQTNAINAAYAGVPQQTQGMLDEARRYAQESAIARGAGQSGVVNWETEKRTTPIMAQAQQLEGEKAAKLSGISDWLANIQSQGSQQEQDLAAREGDLTQQYLQLLTGQNEGQSVSDWQNILSAFTGLAGMSQGANNDANNYGLSALPYFLQDAGGLVNTRQNDALQ